MNTILDGWNKFWFEPASPAPICVFRILCGFLLICSGLLFLPELITWFGEKGLMTAQTSQRYLGNPRFSLLLMWPGSDTFIYVLLFIYIAASFGLMIGFKPRVCAAIAFLILTSFHHRNVVILNSGDTLLRVFSFFFIFAPSSQMYAVDTPKRAEGEAPPPVEPWVQRMMQFQVSAVYFQTVLAKLGGEMWRNGTALYYASRLEELYRLPVPFFFDNLFTIKILTWGTLVAEGLLATLMFLQPPIKYYILAMGVMLHLGIEWSMNIPLFEWVMISSYVLFLEPKIVERFMSRIFKGTAGGARHQPPEAASETV